MSKPTARKPTARKPANRDVVSTRLIEVQRIVLSGAAERADGAATLPERMTEKAAEKLAASLIETAPARRGAAGAPSIRTDIGSTRP
jgi:hypothetical protein